MNIKSSLRKPLYSILLMLLLITGSKLNAQYVNIPDAYFKALLLASVPHKTSKTEITLAEAAAYKGGIDVQTNPITDLTGIEAFTSIDSLDCNFDFLSTLNLSANKALIYLDCSGNYITHLDLQANAILTYLYCDFNSLSYLNITGIKTLEHLIVDLIN